MSNVQHPPGALNNPKYVSEAMHQVPVANRLYCKGLKTASKEYPANYDQIKWGEGTAPVRYATKKRPRQFIDPGLNLVDPNTGEVIQRL